MSLDPMLIEIKAPAITDEHREGLREILSGGMVRIRHGEATDRRYVNRLLARMEAAAYVEDGTVRIPFTKAITDAALRDVGIDPDGPSIFEAAHPN